MVALVLGLQSCSDDFSEPPIPTPAGGAVGTGAWDSPMTAWQAYQSSSNPQYPDNAWVRGYIVGTINTSVAFTVNEKSATLTAPFSASSNLLLTWLDPEDFKQILEYDPNSAWEYTCTVQLVSGTEARSAVNLSDNPDNLYKEVCLQGTTGSTYMGAGGVRTVIDYNWGAQGKEPTEQKLPAATGAFYQNFQKYTTFSEYSTLGWTNDIEDGKFVGWITTTLDKNTYMAVDATTAYQYGGPYVASMLTPPIDMDQVADKTLAFDLQIANQNDNSSLSLFAISQNEDGTWSNEMPLNANIPVGPASGFGEWQTVSGISLADLSGVVRIGWKYISEYGGMTSSTTYCVDNVNVGNQEAPEVVDFGSDVIASMLSGNADDWTFDNVNLSSGLSYVWQWASDGYLKASAYSGGNKAAVSYAVSPVISLKGCTGCNVTFDQAAKFQTTLKDLCKFVIREAGTEEWTEVEIPYWPSAGSWSFATSGQVDIHQFDGKDVQVGFKYESTTEGADTWEIKNLQVLGYSNK